MDSLDCRTKGAVIILNYTVSVQDFYQAKASM
jgi:hypothetical protein